MPITPRVFLLRVIDRLMRVARQRPVAARRIRIELTARLHRDVSGLLYGLHREIFGRLDDDRPLATDPGNNGWPVFVVMAPAGLAFLAATTRLATQRLLPTPFDLPLVAGGMIQLIRFDRALQLALHLIGQGGIAQPLAPTVARPDMHSYLSGNASR